MCSLFPLDLPVTTQSWKSARLQLSCRTWKVFGVRWVANPHPPPALLSVLGVEAVVFHMSMLVQEVDHVLVRCRLGNRSDIELGANHGLLLRRALCRRRCRSF